MKIFNIIYLFIYLFTQANMCWGCPLPTQACGGKPSLFSSPEQCILKCWFLSDFEQLCGTWILVAKFYCWIFEVRSQNKKASHEQLKHKIFTLTKGMWMMVVLDPYGSMLGHGAPLLWYMFELSHSKQSWPFLMVLGLEQPRSFFFFSNGWKTHPKKTC